MVITILIIILSICFVFILWFFALPWLFGAPYDVTREKAMKNILILTNPQNNNKIAELGSGDGRVCIQLAQKNKKVKITGFEINPFLVLISRRKIKKLGLQNQIKIYWKNFWTEDLSKFNKVVFFQFKHVTSSLEKKFDKELKRGTKIISHNWPLPNYKVKKKLGKHKLLEGAVYLYEK